MKDTKRKQKVLEIMHQYLHTIFDGGVIKVPAANKIVGEGWNG